MRRHPVRAALALAVALSVSAGVAACSGGSGESTSAGGSVGNDLTVDDPAGDAVNVFAMSDGPRTVEPGQGAEKVDVTATRYLYTDESLVIWVRALDVGEVVGLEVTLRTGAPDLVFLASGVNGSLGGTNDRGDLVRCTEATFAVDPASRTYRYEIPSRCFGAPEEVRVGLVVSREQTGRPYLDQMDDANVDEPVDSGATTTPLTLTPPIRRG